MHLQGRTCLSFAPTGCQSAPTQAVPEHSLDALCVPSSTATDMSLLDDLHWVRIEGLSPDVTKDDIIAYFQSARCGSGIVKILVYTEKEKTAAVLGIEGIDANGGCYCSYVL